MRSIFVKLLAWFLATLALAFVAFVFTSIWVAERMPPPNEAFRSVDLQFMEAREAYESGGKEALKKFFQRQRQYLQGERYLTDADGIDLITGENHSDALARAIPNFHRRGGQRPPRLGPVAGPLLGPFWGRGPNGPREFIVARNSADGKYKYLFIAQRRNEANAFLPYYLWILVAMVLLVYGLAVYLARPLTTLERMVERFGEGELSLRMNSNRKDEFGKLARSFDRMADRIEALLRSERRLLGDISHELRSPLARLGFAIEIARSNKDLDTALSRIQKEAHRLNSLVGGLLEVTRAEAENGPGQVTNVRLAELVAGLIDDCRIEAEAKDCHFEFEAKDKVALNGDSELLRRAIENVMRNAIRHAPRDTAIEVGLESSEETACVSVRDYGSGVPEDHLSDIFKPFFRVDTARTRDSGGVGLGLAIAKRAVAFHHGEMKAQNMSPGLRVTIELPLGSK